MAYRNIAQSAKFTGGISVGIALAEFNRALADLQLKGALRAAKDSGVAEDFVTVVRAPGALEIPLVLQTMAESEDFDVLVALGAVVKGDTYHFEIVSNESAAGVTRVGLDYDMPIGNGILTTYTDEQATARAEQKGYEAVIAALVTLNAMQQLND